MRRVQACFAIAGAILLLTPPLKTQTTQSNATTFSSSTELVLVPTVVSDKSGVHIPGLQKDEFALRQDGRSHPIAVFEEVKTSSARLHRSEGHNATFINFESGSRENHRLNIIV